MLKNRRGSFKVYPIPNSLVGFKCQSFKFLNNLVNCQYFYRIYQAIWQAEEQKILNILDGILVWRPWFDPPGEHRG